MKVKVVEPEVIDKIRSVYRDPPRVTQELIDYRNDNNKTGKTNIYNDKHQGYIPTAIHPPEVTNEYLVHTEELVRIKPVEGPIYIKRGRGRPPGTGYGTKWLVPENKTLRDKIIAHTPEGKRIFAYNKQGIPICFSRCTSDPTGRCQKTQTYINGRCHRHGGASLKGAAHPRATHLRTAQEMPVSMQEDMRRADLDPDLLSLRHEIQVIDTEIAEKTRGLEVGISESAEIIVDRLIQTLSKKSDNPAEVIRLIEVWNGGKSRDVSRKRLDSLFETRRKLVDSQHRREKDMNLLMKQDQAMALVIGVSAGTREALQGMVDDIQKRYQLVDIRKLNADSLNLLKEHFGPMLSNKINPEIVEKFKKTISDRLGRFTATNITVQAEGL